MTYLIIDRSSLGTLEPLGAGGTALVYQCPDLQLPGLGALVYKEYKNKIRTAAGPALLPGLSELVTFREKLDAEKLKRWDAKTVWPVRVVIDRGAAVGILMRLIPPEYFVTTRTRTGEKKVRPAELDLLLGADDDMRRQGLTPPTLEQRIAVCRQTVMSYASAHERGTIAGDLSARNAVYAISPDAIRVLLVDCDSFRVKGRRSAFGGQPQTPGWEPPESLSAARLLRSLRRDPNASASQLSDVASRTMAQSTQTDVYKVALLVLRLLDHGRNRTRNRNATAATAVLSRHVSPAVARLLEQALDPEPKRRPHLDDWYYEWLGKRPTRRSDARARQLVNPFASGPSPAAPTSATPPTSPAPTRTSGSWTLVEGVGWTRTAAGGTGN